MIEVGQKFARLTAVAPAGQNKHRAYLWLFRCDCGTEKVIQRNDVVNGATKSCGCWNRETAAHRCKSRAKGFDRSSPEYRCWVMIRQRCRSSRHHSYPLYGGRGIKVCARWNSSFEAFLSDMGPRPEWASSIDRIDVNGDYEPGNCRWSTPIEQANNKRNNRIVIYRGVEMTLAQAYRSADCPISKDGVAARLERGWPIERALTEGRIK